MRQNKQLKEVEFKGLLKWFSSDEEEAGEKYEKIHNGLRRYFRYRGCTDPDSLADETINRVATKLSELDLTQNTKKVSVFYGFALNIYREYLAKSANREILLNPDLVSQTDVPTESNGKMGCLEKCLSTLSDDEKNLILTYYSKDKGEKIILRKKMAEKIAITTNALHVRIYRIKENLKNCVEDCLKKNM